MQYSNPITTEMRSSIKKQLGFNLIESLVTLFILTIGVLGIAGLQVLSMTSQKDSSNTDQAIMLANGIAERVRANPKGELAGFYDQTSDQNIGVENLSCLSTNGCTPEQMALNDIFQWQTMLKVYLPEGKGLICKSSTVPSRLDLANKELRQAVLDSCDGLGDKYVVHVMWERVNEDAERNELNLIAQNGKMNTTSSDGYVQIDFTP